MPLLTNTTIEDQVYNFIKRTEEMWGITYWVNARHSGAGKIEIEKMKRDPDYIPQWKQGTIPMSGEAIEDMYFTDTAQDDLNAGLEILSKQAEEVWKYLSENGPEGLARELEDIGIHPKFALEVILGEAYYHLYHLDDYLRYILLNDWAKDIIDAVAVLPGSYAKFIERFWFEATPGRSGIDPREESLARDDYDDWLENERKNAPKLPRELLGPLYLWWNMFPTTHIGGRGTKFFEDLERKRWSGALYRRDKKKKVYEPGRSWRYNIHSREEEEGRRNTDVARALRKRGEVYLERGWWKDEYISWLKFRDLDGKWKIVDPMLEVSMRIQLSRNLQGQFKKKYLSESSIRLNKGFEV